MKTFNYSTLDQNTKTFFDEHGWIHIKNVFAKSEIEDLRKAGKATRSEKHQGDLLSFPETSSLVYDERLVFIAKLLLDTEKPVYCGDSNCVVGYVASSWFHKDNTDRFNQSAPDWQSPYTLLRMGIYLQDHVTHSEGLAIRDKSHHTIKTGVGKPFYVLSEPGDLVVWNMRTSHAGNNMRLSFAPNTYFPNRLVRFVPKFFFLRADRERIAYFIGYAKSEDNHLKRFIEGLKRRKYAIDMWKHSQYDKSQLENAEKVLQVIDMREEAMNVPESKQHELHQEIEF
jgi:hypothetical protein